MEGLNYFRHNMQVATRLAIYRPFLTEKTLENAKLVENPNNLVWFLELVIQDRGKKWLHFKDVKKQRAQTPSPLLFSMASFESDSETVDLGRQLSRGRMQS